MMTHKAAWKTHYSHHGFPTTVSPRMEDMRSLAVGSGMKDEQLELDVQLIRSGHKNIFSFDGL